MGTLLGGTARSAHAWIRQCLRDFMDVGSGCVSGHSATDGPVIAFNRRRFRVLGNKTSSKAMYVRRFRYGLPALRSNGRPTYLGLPGNKNHHV